MDATAVATVCGLGRVRTAVPVPGGHSHRMWRLHTDSGQFAVKQLVAGVEGPGVVDAIEAACRIERRAADGGVPMPWPVTRHGHCLFRVDRSWYRVHHWMPGRSVTVDEVAPEAVGALLAAIHRVGRRGYRRVATVGPTGWQELAGRLRTRDPVSAGDLEQATDTLRSLQRRTLGGPGRVLGSHADLDPTNVRLVPDGGLAALDWDCARFLPPEQELVQVALHWSSADTDAMDAGRFAAVLAGYLAAGGPARPRPSPDMFGCWVAGWLWWLEYNAAERIATDPDMARYEIAVTLAILRRGATSLNEWIELLRGGIHNEVAVESQ